MKALHIGISTVVLLSLAGCGAMGLGSKRIDYHAGAVQAPSLEVPPGLTSPGSDDRYKVPGARRLRPIPITARAERRHKVRAPQRCCPR
jgi:uncharacterized lipoprotein